MSNSLKNNTKNTIGLALLLLSSYVHATATIEHWQTTQGSSVFYVATKGLPMIDVRVVFDAGSARDGKQQGIASLVTDVLGTGAGQWTADDIAKNFESVGGQFYTGVSRDMAWLSLRSLTAEKKLQKALHTFRTVLSQPQFNQHDFQREKHRTLTALKHRAESAPTLASIAFSQLIYKAHPYAHPIAGITATVSALSADDLQAFYKRYYVASNALVVIVGDVKKQQAKAIAESLIAGLATGKKPPTLPDVVLHGRGVNQHIEFPASQTHVLAGAMGMHRKDPDYFNLYVGNQILGGGGLVSRLSQAVREQRGLAYSVYSYFMPLLKNGLFVMGLQTRNDQTMQAIQIMQETLANFVTQGPTPQELLATQKNLTGGFAMRFDTNRKLTDYVAMIGFYRLALDYLDVFQQKINAVTVTTIKDAFARRVKPENINIVTVGTTQ